MQILTKLVDLIKSKHDLVSLITTTSFLGQLQGQLSDLN